MLVSAPIANGADETSIDDESTHELYTLLDSAGRLQIPRELLTSRGIRDRVKLTEEGDRIVIMPPSRSSTTKDLDE